MDNIMAYRKGTQGQTMTYKTLHKKLKIEQHEPTKSDSECSGATYIKQITKLRFLLRWTHDCVHHILLHCCRMNEMNSIYIYI